eukprot:TRINITY_DN14280_c0_g3_i1.p1 TRINITY_DN14280_c0_g3~~TRINITY_DN14280_c0_g3_i1.p1  ORF type:complete len:108 (+),score=25.53 TRINITY_DN14280_c0_g3_i1:132-455(+)
MNHISPTKTADGTGRDTYIIDDDITRRGKLLMETTSSQKPFKAWRLRGHAAFTDSVLPQLSPGKVDASKFRPPSLRRGGRGWMPSIDVVENRRVQERFDRGGLPRGF